MLLISVGLKIYYGRWYEMKSVHQQRMDRNLDRLHKEVIRVVAERDNAYLELRYVLSVHKTPSALKTRLEKFFKI